MPLANLEPQTQRLYPPTDLPGVSEGDWVDIIPVYTSGMRRRAIARATDVGLNDLGRLQATRSFDVFAFRQALLEEIIRAWSDTTPVSPEAIEALRPEVQDWINEEFDRLTGERSEPEKKVSALSSRNGRSRT